jgi:hypothetical protein
MIANHLFEFCGYLIQSLTPGNFQEVGSYALERLLEPIGVMLVVGYFQAFSAAVTFTSLIVPVWSDF